MPETTGTARAHPGVPVRRLTRWALMHGVVRAAGARAARRGDLHATFMNDDRYRADPFPYYEQVRARGRLVQGSLASITASYDVCQDVLRSDDFRVGPDEDFLPGPLGRIVAWARDPASLGPIDPPSMLAVNPPEHTKYRRLVSKVFTPKAVEGLRTRTQEIADDLLDRMAGRDPVDLVQSYATLLPVAVISEVLGVPAEDHATVLRFGHEGAPALDVGLTYRDYRRVDAAIHGFQAWLGNHLEHLRRNPGDNLLSRLVQLEDEGQRLNDAELRATAGLLLAAGFETTVNLLGSATVMLLECPDQLAVLREDPSLWPNAVEEALRLEGPVQLTGRFADRDTEVAGQRLRKGSLVITYLGGANRDPGVFADPTRFLVRRKNARDHLTFSAGRHICVGAALARLEGEIGLRSLFDRYPDLALAGPGRRRTTRVLRGWEQLPVRTRALQQA
ncbi:MAG: cytochrome hydroxylase [Frankiales bacterium]|jgi:cytochrome P450|nr:cytochrome hydroxylase [Frankiales bacterium]